MPSSHYGHRIFSWRPIQILSLCLPISRVDSPVLNFSKIWRPSIFVKHLSRRRIMMQLFTLKLRDSNTFDWEWTYFLLTCDMSHLSDVLGGYVQTSPGAVESSIFSADKLRYFYMGTFLVLLIVAALRLLVLVWIRQRAYRLAFKSLKSYQCMCQWVKV